MKMSSKKAHIPIDVLVDILQCLDRNNIEKSQLVSFKWDQATKAFTNILPLRLIRGAITNQGDDLIFSQPQNIIHPIDLPKYSHKLSLKNCILDNIRLHRPFDDSDSIIGEQLKDFDMQILLQNLEKFVGQNGEKIRVRRFEYSTLDAEKDEVLLKNMEKLLSSLLSVYELNLHLTEKHLSIIFKNPNFLKIPSLPKSIKLDCLSNNFVKIMRNLTPSTPMPNFILDMNTYLDFMKTTKSKTQLVLTSMPSEEEFCKKYVNLFRKIADPQQLCRKVEIYDSPSKLATSLGYLNNLLDATKTVEEKEKGVKVVYKIRRPDGWVLSCESVTYYRICYIVVCE